MAKDTKQPTTTNANAVPAASGDQAVTVKQPTVSSEPGSPVPQAQPTSTALAPSKVTTAMEARAEALAGALTVADDGFADIKPTVVDDYGETVTGGFDGPQWHPIYDPGFSDLKPEALALKVGTLKCEVITRRALTGKVIAKHAWGRKLYFLEVIRNGQPLTIKMPEHIPLYEGLNKIRLGATVVVKLTGKGVAKEGKNAPFLYQVTCMERGAAYQFPRKRDSLHVEGKEAREARIARYKAARDAGQNADEPDDGYDIDDANDAF